MLVWEISRRESCGFREHAAAVFYIEFLSNPVFYNKSQSSIRMQKNPSATKKARKQYRSKFLENLFKILEVLSPIIFILLTTMGQVDSFRENICWSEDGSYFLVSRPNHFAQQVLPIFFKHDNLSSFTRQVSFDDWNWDDQIIFALRCT